MSLSKPVNMAHAQTPVPCDSCDDEVPGEYYCIDCKKTLCPECEKFHRKFTKNHNVVLRSQIGDVGASILNCTEHDDHVSVHCEKCNIPICIKCVTERHQGHRMVELGKIFEEKKEIIQIHLNKIQQDILPMLEERRDYIESERKNYDMVLQKVTQDMEAENQSFQKELDRIHNERKNRLRNIQQTDMLVFDDFTEDIMTKIESIKRRESEYQGLLQNNSLPALINFSSKTETPTDERERPELPTPPSFRTGSIQMIEENVLQLHLSSFSGPEKILKQTSLYVISTFKSPLKGVPSICFANESNMWLGGTGSREIVMVDTKGHVIEKRKMKNRIYALAVMNSGDIIISPDNSDSKSVCRVQADGKEHHVLGTSLSGSRGISVTADQNLLICTFDGELVRTNDDGTNMKQLYKGSGLGSVMYALENADGNIYISDLYANQIVIVNSSGTVLSKLTHTTDKMKIKVPLGLANDKMGNILCASKDNNCIFVIDQNYKMREFVGPSLGINQPRQLAVDMENNLWIAQQDGVINVVKYFT